jgi:hypothetical protein
LSPISYDILAYEAYLEKVAKMLCAVPPEDKEGLSRLAREYVNVLDKLAMLEDLYADHVKEQL